MDDEVQQRMNDLVEMCAAKGVSVAVSIHGGGMWHSRFGGDAVAVLGMVSDLEQCVRSHIVQARTFAAVEALAQTQRGSVQ